MAKLKPTSLAILTANDLLTGAIVYWSGTAWTFAPADAVRAADLDGHGALEQRGKSEEAVNTVVGAYLVALDPHTAEPLELRERQRIAGPSIPLPVNLGA